MKMASIMIFAGTTEGRKIAEFLRGHAPKVYVLTATEYGKEQVEDGEKLSTFSPADWMWRECGNWLTGARQSLLLTPPIFCHGSDKKYTENVSGREHFLYAGAAGRVREGRQLQCG